MGRDYVQVDQQHRGTVCLYLPQLSKATVALKVIRLAIIMPSMRVVGLERNAAASSATAPITRGALERNLRRL